MTAHGLSENFRATVVVCTCGDVLISRGSEDGPQVLAAHAQGPVAARGSDQKQHDEDRKKIRIFRDKGELEKIKEATK